MPLFYKKKGKCICCKKRPIPSIGIQRKNGNKKHLDWCTRCFHKKCFVYLKNKIEYTLT